MKRHSCRSHHGFTLIELLIVISIIAVLAGAGFTAGLAAIQKAKKAKTLNVAKSLEQAVNNFYSENGYLPADGTGDEAAQNDNDGSDEVFSTGKGDKGIVLLSVLAGRETTTEKLNPKSINYLNLPEGKGDKDGVVYEDDGDIEALYDPWGGLYSIALDSNYNERLAVKTKAADKKILNGRRVAIWSDGADAAKGTATGKATDDVTSW